MSHELRAPMNAILGFGRLLELKTFGELNPRQREYVSNILYAGGHLLNLIDDLLDLGKIEAAQLQVTIERVELAPPMDRLAASLVQLAAQHEVELSIKMRGGLTAAADATRLGQVLFNLVSNAIKYNRPGGTIRISDEACADGWLRIAVTDRGIGISARRQRKVFEPFNRLGAERGTIEGTGIGLPISKRLAELMGGHLDFESTPGVGSKFWIDLPARAPADPPGALRDSLTGLPNAPLLSDRVSGAIRGIRPHANRHIGNAVGEFAGRSDWRVPRGSKGEPDPLRPEISAAKARAAGPIKDGDERKDTYAVCFPMNACIAANTLGA
jgi:two-component sensor histidine kinase